MKKYQKLHIELRKAILNGKYGAGEKIPSHKEMMETRNVSLATVVHATRLLVEEGLITRRRKAGSFVNAPPEVNKPLNARIYLVGPPKQRLATENLSWFVAEELYKGIVNNCSCEIKMIEWSDIEESMHVGPSCKGYFFRGMIDEKTREILSGMPLVWLHSNSDYQLKVGCNNVRFDLITSAAEAVSWFLRNGHRQIGCLFSHPTRYAGYRMALNTYSVPFEPRLVKQVYGKIKQHELDKTALEFIENNQEMTALFVDTDMKALWILEALRKSGVDVPGDISIMGFDNIPGLSEYHNLTTLDVPRLEMGKAAVKMLEELMRNNNQPVPAVLFNGKVVERATCRKLENGKNE